jgi:hypothetical protein
MIGRAWLVAATAVAALVVGVGIARSVATEFDIHAALDPRQEVPKPPHPGARASGVLTDSLDPEARTLTWKLVYTGLSGPAIAAEIRRGKPGARGPLALNLCGPRAAAGRHRCRSGMHGVAKLDPDTVSAVLAGYTYVHVRTSKNPNGEIRGQILTMR